MDKPQGFPIGVRFVQEGMRGETLASGTQVADSSSGTRGKKTRPDGTWLGFTALEVRLAKMEGRAYSQKWQSTYPGLNMLLTC